MTVTHHRQVGEVLWNEQVTPALRMLYRASQALQIYHGNILLMKNKDRKLFVSPSCLGYTGPTTEKKLRSQDLLKELRLISVSKKI